MAALCGLGSGPGRWPEVLRQLAQSVPPLGQNELLVLVATVVHHVMLVGDGAVGAGYKGYAGRQLARVQTRV